MSDIIWGDPIEVNGKRPEWPEDGDQIKVGNWLANWRGRSEHFTNWYDIDTFRLPADHGYYARCGQRRDTESVADDPDIEKMMAGAAKNFCASAPDDWQPCERTVRACIEALPKDHLLHTEPWSKAIACARRNLEALLPKADPAEALVKEWLEQSAWEDMGVRLAVEEYTRHLINTERLRP